MHKWIWLIEKLFRDSPLLKSSKATRPSYKKFTVHGEGNTWFVGKCLLKNPIVICRAHNASMWYENISSDEAIVSTEIISKVEFLFLELHKDFLEIISSTKFKLFLNCFINWCIEPKQLWVNLVHFVILSYKMCTCIPCLSKSNKT